MPDAGRARVFGCSGGWATPAPAALVYGRRFGIESSDRPLGARPAAATSGEAVYRRRLVGVSRLIRAWWARGDRPALTDLRWELVLVFTTTAHDPTGATQTDTPQPHTTRPA